MKNLSKEEVRTGMMTLQECKDQIAQKHYYSEWSKLCPNGNLEGVPDKWIDEVAELYASQFKSQSEAVGWISVKDRLPEVGLDVWINTEYYQSKGTYLGSDQYGDKF